MTKYDQLKQRLGIKVQRRNVFTFDHDYHGAHKPEPERLPSGPAYRPPITEDLSRFGPNPKAVRSAKTWWAGLTPSQRAKEVAKRRKNGAACKGSR
jgi:hypothetical protein